LTRARIGAILLFMTNHSNARKRPLPEERLEVILPADLKLKAQQAAQAAKLPLRVYARLALEKQIQESATAAA
jgi:hypothetical protein